MWLLLCVFVGVAAAVTANHVSGKRGVGLAFDAVLGVTGAYMAGFVFNRLAGAASEAVSVLGLLVCAVGAAAILVISWVLVGRDGPAF